MAGSVPGTLQVGVGGKLHSARSDKRLRPDLCSVTSCRGASWRLSRTEGICRQKRRDGGTGRPAESALGNQPFMSRRLALSFRGSHLFATEAARQILAVLLHLLLLCNSRPPPHLFPTLYSYTLHLSNAQKRTGAQWRDILAAPQPCTGVLTQGEQRYDPPTPPSSKGSALLDCAAARVILKEWSITGQGADKELTTAGQPHLHMYVCLMKACGVRACRLQMKVCIYANGRLILLLTLPKMFTLNKNGPPPPPPINMHCSLFA